MACDSSLPGDQGGSARGVQELFGELDGRTGKTVWEQVRDSGGRFCERLRASVSPTIRGTRPQAACGMLGTPAGRARPQRRVAAYVSAGVPRHRSDQRAVPHAGSSACRAAERCAGVYSERHAEGTDRPCSGDHGAPLQCAHGRAGESIGAGRRCGSGKELCPTRLVREGIFPESGIAAARGLERGDMRARMLVCRAGAVSIVCGAVDRKYSQSSHCASGARHGQRVKSTSWYPSAGDEAQMCARERARDPGGYGEHETRRRHAGLGLCTSRSWVRRHCRYRNALRDALVPRLAIADAFSKWQVGNRACRYGGHVRAIRDEAIIKIAPKAAPAKAT